MSELIVRHLRRAAYVMFTDGYQSGTLAEQAADEIDRLTRELAEAREALEPFIKLAKKLSDLNWEEDGVVVFFDETHKLTFKNFSAVSAMKHKP